MVNIWAMKWNERWKGRQWTSQLFREYLLNHIFFFQHSSRRCPALLMNIMVNKNIKLHWNENLHCFLILSTILFFYFFLLHNTKENINRPLTTQQYTYKHDSLFRRFQSIFLKRKKQKKVWMHHSYFLVLFFHNLAGHYWWYPLLLD